MTPKLTGEGDVEGVKKKVGKIMPLRMAKYVSETC